MGAENTQAEGGEVMKGTDCLLKTINCQKCNGSGIGENGYRCLCCRGSGQWDEYQPNRFTLEQVKTICGGKFPKSGCAWDCVEFFIFEDGVFQPYTGDGDEDDILPLPGIVIQVRGARL